MQLSLMLRASATETRQAPASAGAESHPSCLVHLRSSRLTSLRAPAEHLLCPRWLSDSDSLRVYEALG